MSAGIILKGIFQEIVDRPAPAEIPFFLKQLIRAPAAKALRVAATVAIRGPEKGANRSYGRGARSDPVDPGIVWRRACPRRRSAARRPPCRHFNVKLYHSQRALTGARGRSTRFGSTVTWFSFRRALRGLTFGYRTETGEGAIANRQTAQSSRGAVSRIEEGRPSGPVIDDLGACGRNGGSRSLLCFTSPTMRS